MLQNKKLLHVRTVCVDKSWNFLIISRFRDLPCGLRLLCSTLTCLCNAPPLWPSKPTQALLSFGWVLSFEIWSPLFGHSHTPTPSPGKQRHGKKILCLTNPIWSLTSHRCVEYQLCFIWAPVCVASQLPPDRPPAVVSTVWRWLWTRAKLPSVWHYSL